MRSTNGTWVLGKGRVSPQDVDGEARGEFSASAALRQGWDEGWDDMWQFFEFVELLCLYFFNNKMLNIRHVLELLEQSHMLHVWNIYQHLPHI